MLANFGIDSFTVTVVDGDNVNLTILNGASKGWGTVCSIGVDVDAGYAYTINGGAVTLADDTLLITVGGDSTVTGVSYWIPVIDSIRDSTALRDSANPQAGRPLDTNDSIRDRFFYHWRQYADEFKQYWECQRDDIIGG